MARAPNGIAAMGRSYSLEAEDRWPDIDVRIRRVRAPARC